jgi:hypothetical protein
MERSCFSRADLKVGLYVDDTRDRQGDLRVRRM